MLNVKKLKKEVRSTKTAKLVKYRLLYVQLAGELEINFEVDAEWRRKELEVLDACIKILDQELAQRDLRNV